jgi:acyl-CoA thioesterase FadM
MPDKVAVTAKLAVNYRAPTKADQFICIRTRIVEQNGRKMKVAATVEDMDGTVLCEAECVPPRTFSAMPV